jgi:hypothetical protein
MVRNRTIPALVAALAVALAAGAGAGSASAAEHGRPGDPNAAIVHRSDQQSAGRLARYWTPDRMRAAKEPPVPQAASRMTRTPNTLVQSHTLPSASAPGAAPTRAARPEGRASSLDAADALSGSEPWTPHGSMPATTVGKLFFSDSSGNGYECTASVIASGNRSMIWTAGHCVTDGNNNWYTNFVFAPDYDNGNAPLGLWEWKSVSAPTAYYDGGDFDFDLAAISLWPRDGVSVADWTGSQGYWFNGGYDWAGVYEFGYPGDTHPARSGIDSRQLRYCIGDTWQPGWWIFAEDQEAIHCDQGHGASGGPWLYDLQLDRGWGYLVGNVSHHDDESSDEEHSPHFGDAAVNVYNAQTNA